MIIKVYVCAVGTHLCAMLLTQVGRNAVFHEVVLELCSVTATSIKDKMMAVGLKNNQLNWKLYLPKSSQR